MQLMSKEKRNKRIVQLESENDIDNNNIEDIAESRKSKRCKISFDAYFQMLMSTEDRILVHHKAPMRRYAEQKGLEDATKEEFDKIFKLY